MEGIMRLCATIYNNQMEGNNIRCATISVNNTRFPNVYHKLESAYT